MTLEMGIWRTEGTRLTQLQSSGVPLESELENYIESDPALLGEPLLLVGRQVRTTHGGFIDLLAVDADGLVHVIELKRDKTPRDVVAQVLDYGSWVASLERSQILEIFSEFRPGTAFDEAFVRAFGGDAPDEVNSNQVLTIVAASVDPATERIVAFLNETFDVPINVVFFRHYRDGDASYLARTWLVSQDADSGSKSVAKAQRTREPWNGRDWYVSFGEDDDGRAWSDARTYGFVSAGGGEWHSRSLKNLPVGARVFVCIPKRGYVGVGTVTREAVGFHEAVVDDEGQERRLADLPLTGSYEHTAKVSDEDLTEYVVSVDWIHTVSPTDAVWRTGMFANQNSACKLRHQFSIDEVATAFGLADENLPA